MRPKTVTRFFIVFCVLLSCMMLAVAYMTVSSYTNYANDPEALRSLPVLESTVSEESLPRGRRIPWPVLGAVDDREFRHDCCRALQWGAVIRLPDLCVWR